MSGLAERVRTARIRSPRRARPARPLHVDGRPSARERIYGLGSVFGKSLRDSRRAILLGGLLLGLLVFFTASQVAAEFGTVAARAQMAALPQQLPPVFRGMLGEPIAVETLGGFLSWRTLNFLPVLLGAWSINALSGLLAGEARRGSLDLLLATPRSRTSVALQKVAAHAVAVGIATLLIGLLVFASGRLFATLPGDEIALGDALAHAAWLWAMALLPGSVAWFVAPVVGRGAAAALGTFVMLESFVIHGYRDAFAGFASLDAVSYFSWSAGHRPIAGAVDWAGVAAVAAPAVVLLILGALVFRTRDVGITRGVSVPTPRLVRGIGGPFTRSFSDRLPEAIGWGMGLGVFGFVFAANAEEFVSALRAIPQVEAIVRQFYPGVDMFTVGGILQLVFFGFGSLLMAAAAGTLAGGWASDENEGRLELVLAAPVRRVRWVAESGLGVLVAILTLAAIVAVLIAIGTLAVGGDPARPALGAFVLGAYGAALAGVGLAVGGLVRPTLAAPVAIALGVTFYLLDTLGAALRLPEAILDLSLTSHLGQPMAGSYDVPGTIACLVLAGGGVAVAAIGLNRRDVTR
jgi:ABC-2 type transport system permease protein